jgi:hypothetical protein
MKVELVPQPQPEPVADKVSITITKKQAKLLCVLVGNAESTPGGFFSKLYQKLERLVAE